MPRDGVTGTTTGGTDPADPYARARHAADELRSRGFDDHEVLLVLGSGWRVVADQLGVPLASVRMAEVEGFLAPVAEGHGSEIRSYDVAGRRLLAYLGRTHLYEGHGANAVVHGVRTAAALGCRAAILTNANGSLRPDWGPGTCVVLSDHLNLSGGSPLTGPRFVDLTDAYAARLRDLACSVHPAFVQGVYAMLHGPNYETAAEAAALARLGADVVGMSTVLEAIAAREAGLEVLALSMVTVVEGAGTGIDPAEVVAQAAAASKELAPVVIDLVRRL
ncbi:MAG TPA: purine-nucleoside phosphorylase [Nocardioidaceae bacterium]|nr:purine-nucleoside phosphorylase [Nocardioidaceae bacterium]